MLRNILLLSILLASIVNANAMHGKLVLNNGHSVIGDVRELDDGSYWVTTKSSSIRYERDEIKYIKIYSTKDTVSDGFISAMKITPGQQNTLKTTGQSGYDNLISRESSKNHIDPALVKAVIKAESNYNKNDISSKGACGLMQLMPETSKNLGVKKIFSPEENIKAGTRFLKYMIDAFDGDIEMGLAAYNAGASTVKRYGKVPPYKETKGYIKNVIRYYRSYGSSGKITSYTDEKGCLNISNGR
jgi:hypothetical protein